MTQFESLIQQLCPEGVKWVPLEEICISISTGLNPRANFKLNEEGADLYYVTVKEINTNKVKFSDNTDRITSEAWKIIENRSHLEKGDILFSGIGTIGKVAYVDENVSNWNCSESIFLIKPKECINGKFLTYVLRSDVAKSQYEPHSSGSIMKGVRKETLKSLSIPLPPLPIQEKIVEILDKFSTLSAELEAELEGRRKQYEYYRTRLLSFDSDSDTVVWKTLGEVADKRCNLSYGIVQPGEDIIGGIPIIRPMDLGNGKIDVTSLKRTRKDISDSYKRTILQGNEILLCVRGTTGILEMANQDLKGCNVTRGIVPIAIDALYNTKYIYHILRSEKIQSEIASKTNGAALQQINIKDLRELSIPIPPLAEQERIVAILDKFEALVTDLSQGLPAEIQKVQQQYEYYRNLLLNFEK